MYVYVVTRWTRELFLINRAYIDEFKSDDVIFSDILKRQNLMRWVGQVGGRWYMLDSSKPFEAGTELRSCQYFWYRAKHEIFML